MILLHFLSQAEYCPTFCLDAVRGEIKTGAFVYHLDTSEQIQHRKLSKLMPCTKFISHFLQKTASVFQKSNLYQRLFSEAQTSPFIFSISDKYTKTFLTSSLFSLHQCTLFIHKANVITATLRGKKALI